MSWEAHGRALRLAILVLIPTLAAGTALDERHLGAVRSVCFCGQRELLSCGDDGRILRWRVGMSSAGLSIDAGFGMGMHGGMGMGAERHHLQLHGEEKWDGEGVAAQLPLNALDISNGLLLAASDAQFVVCMRAARYA